ncbi:ribosome assembly protein BSM1 [Naegleria gruberi]|uniref:Ribosome assembly protein BSM1 n=1 Tax=Naegleria gruberi TaxID=5762 RepID=D2V454_NAEGR|nr:ribosome assembly protein BSM1 [Naegleria gruberi]EFC48321.1 ribosome assembly protein BSM1 [Naegleria gruberi]|eukprot:XP_002681065.1 ribosome assembly protein BSM1 [Naegleria gruberi strain NEG-M]
MSSSGGGGGGLPSEQQINKEHKARRAGNKFKKREVQRKKKLGVSEEQQKGDYVNNRANTVGKGNAFARDLKYKLDKFESKLHAPIVSRIYGEGPPKMVAVVGPPKSGKTTLITSLVKQYTKQTLTEVTGPITVRTGKSRTTFFECPNEINAMIDMAKTADLVLLLIDASYGFEMENFEFLNMLQVHGMTRVMGVLTHLDLIKKARTVRKLKKKLKHRFWTEVCDGAKLFYLSGLRGGLYTPRETINLSRFISIIKPRPIKWRTTHPCVVVDRFEDVTDPQLIEENSKIERHVCLYGYVRNTFLRKGTPIHIPGCGDFTLNNITTLEDPLPPKPKEKQRSKLDKFKGLYGPMSNLGSVFYDKDNVYIDISNNESLNENNRHGGIDQAEELLLTRKGKDISSEKREERKHQAEETSKIVKSLIEQSDINLDEKISNQQVKLFSGAKSALIAKKSSTIVPSSLNNNNNNMEDDDDEDEIDEEFDEDMDEEEFLRKYIDNEAEEDDEDDDEMSDDEDSKFHRKRRGIAKLMGDDEDNDDEIYAEALNTSTKSSKKKENIVYDDSDEEDDDLDENTRKIIRAGDDDEEYFEPRKLKVNESTGQFEIEGNEEEELSDLEEEDGTGSAANKWKEGMEERASSQFYDATISLQQLVYGEQEEEEEDDGEANQNDDDEEEQVQQQKNDLDDIFNFKKQITEKKKKLNVDRLKVDFVDRTRTQIEPTEIKHDWEDAEFRETIRNKFVTGDWSSRRDANNKPIASKKSKNVEKDEEEQDEMEDDEIQQDDENDDILDELQKKRMEKKKSFDAQFDEKKSSDKKEGSAGVEEEEEDPITTIEKLKKKLREDDPQMILNKTEFQNLTREQREEIEGISPGSYVRLEINSFPTEFIENVNFKNPIIVGGMHPEECRMGLIKMRMKRHRWYPRTLKNKDPLVFSIGWRRFQSIPTYCMQDDNGRHRQIKYTPEYMHCIAAIYGPFVPQNTGVIAFQTLSEKVDTFRVSATGYVMEMDQDFSIVKKLKLLGYPKIVHKNTCIVTKMFTSDLEVAKYEGASLRTVSGLRGSVKKPFRGDKASPGDFRATFEDKLIRGDIIFLRCWYALELERFYNPVYNHLTKKWYGMRTVSQLRKLKHLPIPVKEDSLYKAINSRSTAGHDAHFVPKPKLLKQLPFSEQRKKVVQVTGLTNNLNDFIAEDAPIHELTTALMSDKEVERANMLRKLKAINSEREKKNSINELKLKMKQMKHQVQEERAKSKSKKSTMKRRAVMKELSRVKKAKYFVNEEGGAGAGGSADK